MVAGGSIARRCAPGKTSELTSQYFNVVPNPPPDRVQRANHTGNTGKLWALKVLI